MELPEVVIIGDNTFNHNNMSFFIRSSALLLTGPNVGRIFEEKIESALAGISYKKVIVNESSYSEAERIANKEADGGYDAVIGFGGGKVLDVAKFVGYTAGIPMVSVPTSASNDGIASPFSSLKGGTHPYSIKVKPPRGVIIDLSIITRAPKRYILSGLGDLLGKFTSVRDWRLAWIEKGEYYGEYASKLAYESARHAFTSTKGIEELKHGAVRNLMEALISAGVAGGIAGSSRPLSGSEHLISHALDVIAPDKGTHGEKVALSTVFISYLYGMNWKRIKSKIIDVGLPQSFEEIGVSKDEVIKAIEMAPSLRPERYTILHKINLTRERIESILDEIKI
ncbi:MAG: iron-containing alcohol dehydrogenase [Nitrososphaeria archaeon]